MFDNTTPDDITHESVAAKFDSLALCSMNAAAKHAQLQDILERLYTHGNKHNIDPPENTPTPEQYAHETTQYTLETLTHLETAETIRNNTDTPLPELLRTINHPLINKHQPLTTS